jgi:hypothetical protein
MLLQCTAYSITVVVTIYFGLMNDSLHGSIIFLVGVFVFLATVTPGFFDCGRLCRSSSRVVVRNRGIHILHAAVTNLD